MVYRIFWLLLITTTLLMFPVHAQDRLKEFRIQTILNSGRITQQYGSSGLSRSGRLHLDSHLLWIIPV